MTSNHQVTMNQQLTPRLSLPLHFSAYVFVPIIVLLILNIGSINPLTFELNALALVITIIPWWSFLRWWQSREGLPVFALIAGMHWLYFVMPAYWVELRIPVWYTSSLYASSEGVNQALLMVLIGVVSIGIGYRLTVNQPFKLSGGNLTIPFNYLRFLLLTGILLSFFPDLANIFGESGRQFIYTLQGTVPTLCYAALLMNYLQGKASSFDRVLIVGYLLSFFFIGLSSGWLGSLLGLFVVTLMCFWITKRSFPWIFLIPAVLLLVLLQPAKGIFRQEFWSDGPRGFNVIERTEFWIAAVETAWSDASNNVDVLQRNVSASLSRVSLLTQAVNVLEKTPEVVPFQNGDTYSFAILGLIPRFIWPDKPSGNDANRFYQVAYGITPEDRLHTVSIAIGFLTEGFVNFGLFGVALVCLIAGAVLGLIQSVFLKGSSNLISLALGISLIEMALKIETQLGLYLVAIVMTLVYTYLVVGVGLLVTGSSKVAR
jgi:hypothetical protein